MRGATHRARRAERQDGAQRRRPVPQVDEEGLAGRTTQDDAPGDADARPLLLRLVGGQPQDVADGLVVVEASAPRVEAERLDGPQLVETAGFKGVGGHGRTLFVGGTGKGGVSQVRLGL